MGAAVRAGAVVAAAGQGRRMGTDGGPAKQFRELGDRPLLVWSLEALEAVPAVETVVVVVPPGEVEHCRARVVAPYGLRKVTAVVAGGAHRQESVRRGLEALPPGCGVVLVHDGARPLASPALAGRLVAEAARRGAAIPGLPPFDTVKRVTPDGRVTATLAREELRLVQTPQAFRRELLVEAHRRAAAEGRRATDDAGLVEALGHPVWVVEGERRNVKVTVAEDLELAGFWAAGGVGRVARIGLGFDVHPCAPGRALVLGGVTIPADAGLEGHSDADVLTHAVIDALLGAAALGDIGRHFPDTDPVWKGARSLGLLERVVGLLRARGLRPGNVDATVAAERPRLAPHTERIRASLAGALGIPAGAVSVKATTSEGLGFVGRGEGLAAWAVALVHPAREGP